MKKLFSLVVALVLVHASLAEAALVFDNKASYLATIPDARHSYAVEALSGRYREFLHVLSPSKHLFDQTRFNVSQRGRGNESAFFAPGALAVWRKVRISGLVAIGWIEGGLLASATAVTLYRLRPHAYVASLESFTDHSGHLIVQFVPYWIFISVSLIVLHYFIGVSLPYRQFPIRKDLVLAFKATLANMPSFLSILALAPGLTGQGVFFNLLILVGIVMGASISGGVNYLIVSHTPHPWGPMMRPGMHLFTLPAPDVEPLARTVMNQYDVGRILRIDWHPGGAKSGPFPIVTTPEGRFAIKRLKGVYSSSNAIYVTEYIRYLRSHNVPIPILHKKRTSGKAPADYYVAVRKGNEKGSESYYYTVEPFIEVGVRITRQKASPDEIRLVGAFLGSIQRLSREFTPVGHRSDREYSFEKAIENMLLPDPTWKAAIMPYLDLKQSLTLTNQLELLRKFIATGQLQALPRQIIPSDLNFSGLKLNEKQNEIIAAFDWDDAREGYRIEDYFATLTQGEGPLYLRHIGRDLKYLLEGVYESQGEPLTSEEVQCLPRVFMAQLLWKIVTRANRVFAKDPRTSEIADEVVSLLDEMPKIERQLDKWSAESSHTISWLSITKDAAIRLTPGAVAQEFSVKTGASRALGEAFYIDIAKHPPVHRFVDAIRHRDVIDDPLQNKDDHAGWDIQEYVRREEVLSGDTVAFGFNSTQGQFWDPNTLLVVEGRLLTRERGRRGLRQAVAGITSHGKFSVLSLDPDNKAIFDIRLENGEFTGSLPMKNGFAGPLLLRNGISQIDAIRFARRPPLSGDEVGWRTPDQRSALTAFGYNGEGALVVVQIGRPSTVADGTELNLTEFVEVLKRLGVTDAILGGASGDVQRYSRYSKPPLKWYKARDASKLQRLISGDDGRRFLGTALLFLEMGSYYPPHRLYRIWRYITSVLSWGSRRRKPLMVPLFKRSA